MKYLNFGFPVCLLFFLGMTPEVSASSWTCQKAELTRQVVVFYPEAPARLPCEVFYAKPKENVLPRALWEAKNTQNYCKRKATEFIEKLRSLGWRCFSDDLEKIEKTGVREQLFLIFEYKKSKGTEKSTSNHYG